MPVTLEQLVQDLSESSVVTSADVSAVVETLPPEKKTAEELAKQLVRQKKLTKFQAQAAFAGKAKGLVFGEYVVVDKLGAGGMGVVFKARHRRMKREVALKVLPQKALDSPDAVERFEREVEAAAKLNHPNIVIAYDAGESNGKHYLVMEFVDGDDIAAVIKRDGPLPVEKTINYTIQAARGLEFAHKKGVVHRDIKPGNLLLDSEGTVKILDMGLARFNQPTSGNDPTQAKGLTQSGQIMGTCEYMAPEQAEDTRSADHRADVYALGCSLYKMLSGKSVYDGQTMIQTLIAHREAEIPSLCDGRDDVPLALDTVFKKMVAKSPEDRYQSMSEVILDLETVEASGDLDEVELMESAPKESSAQTALTSFFQNIKTQDSDATPKAVDATAQVDRRPLESNRKWLCVGGGVAAFLIVAGLVFALWPDGSDEVDGGGEDRAVAADSGPIDLLKLIDVERDAVKGIWEREGNRLTSPHNQRLATVHIPYVPPSEYDLRLLLRRIGTLGDSQLFSLGLVVDGTQFGVILNGEAGSGFNVDGEDYKDSGNETLCETWPIPDNEPVNVVVNARNSHVVISCNNKTVLEWTGDIRRLGRLPGIISPHRNVLYLGTNTAYSFEKIELTPITGTGRPLYPSTSDPDRAAAEWVLGIGGSIGTNEGKITDVGQLPQEPFRIISVDLHGNRQVTDENLEILKGLTNLTAINLIGTQFSDAGLEQFKGLTTLRGLFLSQTKVSDTGLQHLKGLVNLTALDLTKTKVTAQGIADLKNALPNCEIIWDDPSNPDPDRAAAGVIHPHLKYEMKAHPPGALDFKGHWYKLFKEKLSWEDAQKRCKEMGGYLACVETEEENQFLVRLVKQASWLGGKRITETGRYIWINGEPMQFKRLTGDSAGDICLVLSPNGLWSRIMSRDLKDAFICEWEF